MRQWSCVIRWRTRAVVVAIVGLATVAPAWAVPPSVTNVHARQRTDASHKVDIWYDLADADTPTLYVSLAVSTNGGATYNVTPRSQYLTGDVGWGVHPGGRHIVWDAGPDLGLVVLPNCKVRITADDNPTEIPETTTAALGFLGLATVCATATLITAKRRRTGTWARG